MRREQNKGFIIVACLVGWTGCKSEPPPTSPAEMVATETNPTTLKGWLQQLEINPPATRKTSPVDSPFVLEDGKEKWNRPTVFLSHHSGWVNGKDILKIDCEPDDCQSIDDGAFDAIHERVGTTLSAVLAVDRETPAALFIRVLRASASKKRPATLLTFGKEGALQGITLEPGAPPPHPGASINIRKALEGGPGADKYLTDRSTLRRGPPIAPGEQVRVTGGRLTAPEGCGGQDVVTKTRRNLRSATACYRLARQRDATLRGKVTLRWIVGQNGRPTEVRASSDEIQDAPLLDCLSNSLNELVYLPHSASPDECRLQWEVKLHPRDPNAKPEKRRDKENQLKIRIDPSSLTFMIGPQNAWLRFPKADLKGIETEMARTRTNHQQILIRTTPSVTTGRVAEVAGIAANAGYPRILIAEAAD